MPHTGHTGTRNDRIVFLERIFFFTVIALKLQLFLLKKGQIIGFDSASFIETTQYVIDSNGVLPSVFFNQTSMHPPLSFLLTAAIALPLQDIVIASQIVSSLSMLIVFIALRLLLKHIGLLWSIPGFVLLYLTCALPIVIFLGMESSYDPLIFAWAMLALLASVKVFWKPDPKKKGFMRFSYEALLILSIVGGMQTKYTGLLFAAFPFCVLLARKRPNRFSRDLLKATLLIITAIILITPLYYQHYYRETGKIFHHDMEWRTKSHLAKVRAERDTRPLATMWQIIRVPTFAFQWDREYPDYRSFPDTIWFETWKRDKYSHLQGPISPFAREVSNFYIFFFSIPLLMGSALFFIRRKKSLLWELGLLLFLITTLFSLASIAFGYHYPVWGYAVFKTKYASPIVLWFTFCTAYCVHWLLTKSQQNLRIHREIKYAAIAFTVIFVFVNHLFVY